MTALREIPGHTRASQRRAADPAASAWVSANAGSGKTHVLAQRVVRLLLAGAQPSKILCLTFTKAAAANMSLRVFRTLAEWTALDDFALAEAIEAIGAPRPDSAGLVFARRLFARAIETPGGLKIQTIHAFCEALLHRFPFEANVPAGFQALDEESQAELLRQARQEALARAAASDELGAALRSATAETTAAGFDKILDEALGARSAILAALERTPRGLGSALRAALGLRAEETAQEVQRSMIEDGVPPADWDNLAGRLDAGSANDRKQAERLRKALAASDENARLDAYLSVFLSAKGEPRQRPVTAALEKRDPDLASRLCAERDRVFALSDRLKAARAIERTQALMALVAAIFERYDTLKARRGWLDFDDLIERTASLFGSADPAWVLYKLDAGLDHVLVDEAQDTSAEQWIILRALVSEFTAGRGARDGARTIFAVGDEKQSIYSFQGAAPHLFDSMRRFFAARHRDASKPFEQVPLTMSFRSSLGVLRGVDQVFSLAENARGLSAEGEAAPRHEAWKTELPGLVEIWDPLRPPPKADPRDWRLPVDSLTQSDPEQGLADRIADRIESWLAPKSDEVAHDERGPRPIRRGDILILVRKRGVLFEAIIRALKDRNLAVAGADRLILAEHIAVMDLMAAGRVALLPQDDLTLACALKSPLIGFDDDDLLALAPRRPGSLWDALRASPDARHQEAARRIEAWRALAAQSPFGFYAHILGAEGGRRSLIARLGPEASDAIDEFLALALDHERRGAPSLAHFLHRMETSSVCVKRDMEAAADSIRVMTVHAAKGLEAKIVILPDTCSAASGRHDPALAFLESPQGPLPICVPRREEEPARLALVREAARRDQDAEHRRLLYVAMTRAEERLYIAGVEGVRGRGAGCWYDMIVNALAPLLEEHPAPWSPQERVLRLAHAWPPGPPGARADEAAAPPPEDPAWLWRPPAHETPPAPPLRPSSALAAADAPRAASFAQGADEGAARLGLLTHALLQHLPELPESARAAAAERYLGLRGAGLAEDIAQAVLARALATIAEPRLAPLFALGSRAEVAICGRVRLPQGGEVDVVGTVDRMAVTGDAIWIADFKAGALPRGEPSRAYLAQLALYRAVVAPLWPDRAVRACLVWTQGPLVIEPAPEAFEAALRSLRA